MDKNEFVQDLLGRYENVHKSNLTWSGVPVRRNMDPDHIELLQVVGNFVYDQLQQPRQELRVKRTDAAKEFPLIRVAKDGDVGMDLPAVLPLLDTVKGMTTMEFADKYGVDPDDAWKLMHGSIVIKPGQRGVIPTGLFLEIPKGYWASIEARSSTSKKMLVCPKGVIDEGYRGELFAVLLNVGTETVEIQHGDRYVQLILHKRCIADMDVVEVDELSQSERGDTGFGSTGQSTKNG